MQASSLPTDSGLDFTTKPEYLSTLDGTEQKLKSLRSGLDSNINLTRDSGESKLEGVKNEGPLTPPSFSVSGGGNNNALGDDLAKAASPMALFSLVHALLTQMVRHANQSMLHGHQRNWRELELKADKMAEAAQHEFIGGITSNVVGIAGGVAGGGFAMKAAVPGKSMKNEPENNLFDVTRNDNGITISRHVSSPETPVTPAPTSVAPVQTPPAPAQTPPAPAQNSQAPAQNSQAPAQNSQAPAKNSTAPAQAPGAPVAQDAHLLAAKMQRYNSLAMLMPQLASALGGVPENTERYLAGLDHAEVERKEAESRKSQAYVDLENSLISSLRSGAESLLKAKEDLISVEHSTNQKIYS